MFAETGVAHSLRESPETTAMQNPQVQRTSTRRRGQSMVEFALSFLIFLSTVLGFGQIALALWIKTTLRHAAREGVRYAITGRVEPGFGHDASIRQQVVAQAAGLISSAQADSLIHIDYYDQSGTPTMANDGGNTIVLGIQDYAIPWLVAAPISPLGNGMNVSASAVDRLEAFAIPPAR